MDHQAPLQPQQRWCPFLPRDNLGPAGGSCLAERCMAWNPATGDCRRLETAQTVRAPLTLTKPAEKPDVIEDLPREQWRAIVFQGDVFVASRTLNRHRNFESVKLLEQRQRQECVLDAELATDPAIETSAPPPGANLHPHHRAQIDAWLATNPLPGAKLRLEPLPPLPIVE